MNHYGMRGFDLDQKPKFSKNIILRIWSYFKPYHMQLIFSIFTILFTTIISLAPPLLLQKIVDTALPQKNSTLLIQYVLLSLLAYIVLNLVQVWQATINMNISRNITYDMKNKMYNHLQNMSQRFFSSEKQGEINTRISSDIDGVQSVFNSTFVSLFTNVFTLATTLFALFSLNWKLALLALITIPIYIIPTRKVGDLRWKITKKRQQALSELNQHTQETLSISGSTLMKVFSTENKEYDTFESYNSNVTDLQKQEEITGRWFRMLMSLLTVIGPLLVYLFGGFLFMRGEISLGVILMFATLLDRLYRPVMQLLNLQMDTLKSFALFERIFEYFDMTWEIEDSSSDALVIDNGSIEFKNVSFSYNEGEPTLSDVNFVAHNGQVMAIVGPSGAGKTTITNLIPRLYDTTSGEILIDGQNIKDVSLSSLRDNIGIVTQEPYLFNGTIAENIKYGSNDVSDDDLYKVSKDSYIHDFIMGLPEQYDTIVGNRGIKLSGGEKQRISIARVLLKNPKILILDEATSALDSLSEEYVQKAIEPLMKNRTSIVIAHRLSTIQNAEQILVVDDGTIIESGNHNKLMLDNGMYADLYNRSLKQEAVISA